MKISRFILLVCAAALLTASGCTPGLPPDVAKLGTIHRGYRFALDLPAGWTGREVAGGEIALTAQPAQPNGQNESNLNVTVVPVASGADLAEVASRAKKGLATLPGFKMLAEEPRTLADGRQAQLFTFQHKFGDTLLTHRQLHILAGGRLYTLTLTARAVEFDRLEPQFEAVLKSFRVAW